MRKMLLVVLVLLIPSPELAAQTPTTELQQIVERVEAHMLRSRPTWKHETVPPPLPPGAPPSRDISIHFWSSDSCMQAEMKIDGVNYGVRPIPCRIKLTILEKPSVTELRESVREFLRSKSGADPKEVPIGEMGYLWSASDLVFTKGRYSFWINGVVTLRVGGFRIDREFTEGLAKEFAEAVGATQSQQ